MRSKLYTVLASAALIAAAAFATNSAMAETTLTVPFSFMVAGQKCPAGHYTVKENPIGTFVTMTNQDSSRVFTWILLPNTPDFKSDAVVLKFDVSGQTHLLRSVAVGSMKTDRLDKNIGSEYRQAELAVHPGQ